MSQYARDYEALIEAFDDAVELLRKVNTGKGYKRAVKKWLDTLPEQCEGHCYEYYPPQELNDDGYCEGCANEYEDDDE